MLPFALQLGSPSHAHRVALLLLAGLHLLGGGSCRGARAAAEPRQTVLFNGKDLSGWNHALAEPNVERSKVWTVQDGYIACSGRPHGVLYTKDKYTNFLLLVEYRWAPGSKPGNSGIITRIAPEGGGPPRAVERSVEVQLAHQKAGDIYGLWEYPIVQGGQARWGQHMSRLAGKITLIPKIAMAEKAPGEWNLVKVEARDEQYRVWINGELVNEVTGIQTNAGAIGLQSEGGELHFRTVIITPL